MTLRRSNSQEIGPYDTRYLINKPINNEESSSLVEEYPIIKEIKPREKLLGGAKVVLKKVPPPRVRPRMKDPSQSPPHSLS